MPSSVPFGSLGFKVQTPSMHEFCIDGSPGRLQSAPGHSVLFVHGVPLLLPPMQRRPPQVMPGGQSAFPLHGSAPAVAQVLHAHSPAMPVQRVPRGSVLVPVVSCGALMSR